MTEGDSVLAELAAPPREQAVTGLLREMAQEIGLGAEVVAEPELRDPAGAVARGGALKLPRRGDLAVTRDGRISLREVAVAAPAPGVPVVLATEGGFVAEVGPFRWDAARLTVFSGLPEPDWAPLRRWFLEWFQSRLSEVAPELLGAVHSLEGPSRRGRGWAFTLDFGSAPVACLDDLIAALAETGAVRMRLT